MDLKDMIRSYEELLARKEALAAETKANSAAIAAMKEEIAAQMLEDDCPAITFGGYSYSISEKVSYTKRSDTDLAAAGINYFDRLREEGLGDIIVETVNVRTLQSTCAAYVAEHGELSEGLSEIIREYEYTDINRRKAATRGKKK